MPDREKVIKWLEKEIKSNDYWDEDYIDCIPVSMLKDILALLKAQEPPTTFHVIDRKTGKEADTYRIALKEKWAAGLVYCDMEGFAVEEDGTLLLLDECGNFRYCDRERFEVVWDD